MVSNCVSCPPSLIIIYGIEGGTPDITPSINKSINTNFLRALDLFIIFVIEYSSPARAPIFVARSLTYGVRYKHTTALSTQNEFIPPSLKYPSNKLINNKDIWVLVMDLFSCHCVFSGSFQLCNFVHKISKIIR